MALLRKDIKIGFLAGSLVLVLGAGYAVFSSFSGSSTGPQQAAADPLTGDPAPPPQAAEEPVPAAGQSAANEWNSLYAFEGREPHITQPPSRRSPPGPAVTTPDETADGPASSPNINEQFHDPQEPLDPVTSRLAGVAETSAPLPAALRTHVVQSGESFSSIAQKYYGDASLYTLIQKGNPDVDSRRLRIGQKLVIPDQDQAQQQAAAPSPGADSAAPAAAAEPGTHVVAPGETLSVIAEKRLGRAALWRELYELNRDIIGGEPGDLKPGMRLRLPA